jgi:hypothetical protein
MIPALPLVGKVLVDLVASGASGAITPQDADPRKVGGAANSSDFAQTVDDLQRSASAATTAQGAHGAARSYAQGDGAFPSPLAWESGRAQRGRMRGRAKGASEPVNHAGPPRRFRRSGNSWTRKDAPDGATPHPPCGARPFSRSGEGGPKGRMRGRPVSERRRPHGSVLFPKSKVQPP